MIVRLVQALVFVTGTAVVSGSPADARKALLDLFKREVPEHSRQLRALWEKEGMLATILSMDVVRDWAGLEPGSGKASCFHRKK